MPHADQDHRFMAMAIKLAERGRGLVEPNPMVGCVLAREGQVAGEGWHRQFGGPHAEIAALAAAGNAAHGAEAFVSLEPCNYQGKTGPCTRALIEAGVARVVVGCQDPNPQVAGQGIAELRAAGIHVDEGVLAEQAAEVIAPFAKFITHGKPWVIAKWAMTWDGKLASRTGSSRWISGEASRAAVHKLRGQVDAVLVGRGTVENDDPLLTARPPGPRIATRVVLDTSASLSPTSKLAQSAKEIPVVVAAGESVSGSHKSRLESLGVEVLMLPGKSLADRMEALLDELGRRQMTNLLVEGGAHVLGTLFDMHAIDEVHVYLAAKLLGGKEAPSPIGGIGIPNMPDAIQFRFVKTDCLGEDIRLTGRVARE